MPKGISGRETKTTCVEYWVTKGYSRENAEDALREHQRKNVSKVKKASEENQKSKITLNQTFGKWVVKTLDFKSGEQLGLIGKQSTWFVQVTCVCGFEKHVAIRSLVSGRSNGCKTCVKARGESHSKWNGYKDLSGRYYGQVKEHAKRAKRTFNISKKFMYDLFEKQNRCCALSGIALTWGDASLDRIDSTVGYEKHNVQWVHKKLNQMKSDTPINEFLDWCVKVSNFQQSV